MRNHGLPVLAVVIALISLGLRAFHSRSFADTAWFCIGGAVLIGYAMLAILRGRP